MGHRRLTSKWEGLELRFILLPSYFIVWLFRGTGDGCLKQAFNPIQTWDDDSDKQDGTNLATNDTGGLGQ